MVKVLVVDDSAFMRKVLTKYLTDCAQVEVVGTACDGEDALQKIRTLDPDVVTLDIEMPRMDGLTTLQHIMKTAPRPVIMISTLTEAGAETTLKALEYGALDFIPKSLNTQQNDTFAQELTNKILAVARKRALMQLRFGREQGMRVPATASVRSALSSCRGTRSIVGIGVSTGGPPAVQKILAALPANFPACIVIAQHMPAAFTGPFAKRLNNVCQIKVTEAQTGDKIISGHAYVAPGGKHMSIQMRGPLPELLVSTEPTTAIYKPSANVLLESVGACFGRRSLGVMLTGMGNDGVDGMRHLKERGGYVIAQNEQSCVVYGMPKAVVDAELADQILDVDDIADALAVAVKG